MRFLDRDILLIEENGSEHLVASKVCVANNFISRFFGLMGQKELKKGYVLMLSPCRSIHMLFMRFAIDVVYVDKALNVVKVVKEIKPWKLDFGHKRAKYTLEFPAGTIDFEPKRIEIRDIETEDRSEE